MSRKAPKPRLLPKPAEPSSTEAAAIIERERAENRRKCGEIIDKALDEFQCIIMPMANLSPDGMKFGLEIRNR